MSHLGVDLAGLAELAWHARERAHVVGKTPVGCAVLSEDGRTFTGCNVEHRFRCHDVHAEVNALTSMIAGGSKAARCIVIVAERDRFTPCGGCLDWIFELGGSDCIVASQSYRDGQLIIRSAKELMPYYPY